jgi:hypothetical protein
MSVNPASAHDVETQSPLRTFLLYFLRLGSLWFVTVSIAVVTFGLPSFKKIPEPFLVLAAGGAGLLLFKGFRD